MNREQTTVGDRLAVSVILAIAAFVTGLLIWGTFLLLGATFIPFRYVLYFTGFFVLLALVMPDRAVDLMGDFW